MQVTVMAARAKSSIKYYSCIRGYHNYVCRNIWDHQIAIYFTVVLFSKEILDNKNILWLLWSYLFSISETIGSIVLEPTTQLEWRIRALSTLQLV